MSRRRLLPLLLLCGAMAFGQEKHEFTLDFDIAYRNAIRSDGFQSELRQSGHWANGGVGFTEIRGKWFQSLYFGGHAGLASSLEGETYNYRDFGGECYYDLLFQVEKPSWPGDLYIGFSSLTDFAYTQNTSFGNNAWSWRLLSGFGAGLAYLYPFEWKGQSFRAGFRQHIPLVVYGSGPVYIAAIIADEEDWEEWTVFGGNQIWRSQYDFEWRLSTGNSFGIRYIWNYGRLNSPNIQHWAFHHVGLVMRVGL